MQNGDEAKQLAILEMGWIIHQEFHPAYTWHGVTEEQQADYLVGAYTLMPVKIGNLGLGLMTTIYFADTFLDSRGYMNSIGGLLCCLMAQSGQPMRRYSRCRKGRTEE